MHGAVCLSCFLLNAGVGHSAVHWCAAKGNSVALRWLLARGADVNATNNAGSTALHAAASNGQVHCCAILFQTAGINPNIENDDGLTALGLAKERKHLDVIEVLQTKPKVPAAASAGGSAGPATRASDSAVQPATADATATTTTGSGNSLKSSSSRAATPASGNCSNHINGGGAAASQPSAADTSGQQAVAGNMSRSESAASNSTAAATIPSAATPATPVPGNQGNSTRASTPPASTPSSTQRPTPSATHPSSSSNGSGSGGFKAAAAAQVPSPSAEAKRPERLSDPCFATVPAVEISRDLGRAWLDAAKGGALSTLEALLRQQPVLLGYQGQGTQYGFTGKGFYVWHTAFTC